jgi:membrane fusion protein (multidrug efflux system)
MGLLVFLQSIFNVRLTMTAVANRQIQVVAEDVEPASAAKRRRMAPSRRTLLVAAVALAVAAGGSLYIAAPPSRESTDDAYIGADVTTVAPKVRGLIAQILVQDNQAVHAGDPLVRIDPEEFDARVATARADLADAQASVASAEAALVSLDAEEQLAAANVRATQTAIRSSQAQAERANLDRHRFEVLVPTGAASQREADISKAVAITAVQEVAHSGAMLDVSRQAASVTAAKRATLTAALQKSQAAVGRAHAALDLALQDQRHTLILAPINGVVGNRQAQPGDYVQPGTRLMTLVPLKAVYVTANFKETQTVRMQPGQRATISVDALTGDDLTGTVESFAPGSGSTFSLLPFEPGTGNFTKIVQRVPVRIRFDPDQPGIARLRPGLSVTARVTLKQ